MSLQLNTEGERGTASRQRVATVTETLAQLTEELTSQGNLEGGWHWACSVWITGQGTVPHNCLPQRKLLYVVTPRHHIAAAAEESNS